MMSSSFEIRMYRSVSIQPNQASLLLRLEEETYAKICAAYFAMKDKRVSLSQKSLRASF